MSHTRYTFLEAIQGLDNVSMQTLDDLIDYDRYDSIFEKDETEFYKELSKGISEYVIKDPAWAIVSGRLLIKSLKTKTPKTFSDFIELCRNRLNIDYYNFVANNKEILNSFIVEDRDNTFSAFAVSTLMKSYLLYMKENKKQIYIETPQYLFLRCATQVWYPNLEKIKEMYDDLSLGRYSHASPTLMNSGHKRNNMASCFLMRVGDDMEQITKSWHDSAIISMNCGGLGLYYGDLRHSSIGEMGQSNGILPWLKIKNEILVCIDQGGKRKGSGTIQIGTHHIDIFEYLDLRKNTGAESARARDLFFALLVDDVFMERVRDDKYYSLFCPHKAQGLNDVYGEDFKKLYEKYEEEFEQNHKGEPFYRRVQARDLYFQIQIARIKVGMPFILYKDAMNRKCNQRNLGMIATNLCCEITEHISDKEIASCNLGAICLNDCVKYKNDEPYFDFDYLDKNIRKLVRNLNNIIDRNYYPEKVPEIKYANLKNRPLGIGVQGLADCLALLDIAFVETDSSIAFDQENPFKNIKISSKAQRINNEIFEAMYYSAVSESIQIAKEKGKPYDSYEGSPASQGLLQYDLWNEEGKHTTFNYEFGHNKDEWDLLKKDLKKYGMYNSLLIANMPTASSAQILGNNEAFEVYTENIYARTTLSGQFIIVNKHLVRDFMQLKLWNTEIIQSIIEKNGSIQHLTIPDSFTLEQSERFIFLKDKYKTAYEIPQKILMELSLDRGRFICQTQSFNCFMKNPTPSKLLAYDYYSWTHGAKTSSYYLRSSSANDAVKFAAKTEKKNKTKIVKCNDDVCMSCVV